MSLQIVASDVDCPRQTLTYSAVNLPDGLSINSATGLISGNITYHAAFHSPYAATVTVSDGTTPHPSQLRLDCVGGCLGSVRE